MRYILGNFVLLIVKESKESYSRRLRVQRIEKRYKKKREKKEKKGNDSNKVPIKLYFFHLALKEVCPFIHLLNQFQHILPCDPEMCPISLCPFLLSLISTWKALVDPWLMWFEVWNMFDKQVMVCSHPLMNGIFYEMNFTHFSY